MNVTMSMISYHLRPTLPKEVNSAEEVSAEADRDSTMVTTLSTR